MRSPCLRNTQILGFFLLLAFVAIPIWACNIPVFRFALERWRSDRLELFIFQTKQQQTPELAAQSQLLTNRSVEQQGSANYEVRIIDPASRLDQSTQDLWETVQEANPHASETPFVVVRGRHIRGPFLAWQGPLSESKSLVRSPVRSELASRLLAGNAIVWLVVESSEEQANSQVHQLLSGQIQDLADSIELPEGIGLPGSELFSEVPLFLKYSVLSVDRQDANESFLLNLFAGFQPEAFEANQPLIIPVFGRGRALEVIPADQISPNLVADLTRFLCAACSCQVKEQNPGFDLLLDVDWEKELFGEGEKPPASSEAGLGQKKRVLLPIPPGKKK